MADALAGIFGPQAPDPLQGVFGGNADFAAASESPLAPPAKKPPTPLLNAVEGGQDENAPQPDQALQDIFAAPQVHPSKKDAAKVAAAQEAQDQQDYANESWGDWAKEKIASAAAGAVSTVGSAASGLGDWLSRVQQAAQSVGIDPSLIPFTNPFAKNANGTPNLNATPDMLKAAGQFVNQQAQTIQSAVPEEHQKQFGNELAGTIGGISTLLGTAMVSPAAVAPELLGQGFDQVNQAMRAKGESGSSLSGLAAETAGGAANAALNMTGLNILLEGVELPIKNAVVRGITSVALRSGADAATFAAQGIVTNLAGQLGVDPNTPVKDWGSALEGAGKNAEMGGLIGAVFGVMGPHKLTPEKAIGEPQPLDLSMAKVFSPDAAFGQQSMARGASLVTPEDKASPLPTDLIQQGKGAMDIDLSHPFDTKMPDQGGMTVQQYVDDYLAGKGRDSAEHEQFAANNGPDIEQEFQRRYTQTYLSPEDARAIRERPKPTEPTDLPDETVTNAAHPSQAPEGEMDRRAGALSQGLTSRGIDPTIADGIAAGIIAESGGDLTAHNKDSGAYGLGQWLGSRRAALFQKYGPNPTFDQQMDFLVSELKGGDPGGKFVLGASNPADALDAYITKFMRPAAGYETERDLTAGEKALGVKKGSVGEAQAEASPEPGLGEVSTTFEPLNVPSEEAAAQAAPDQLQPFGEDSGTLGVPRSDMPQIKSEDHGALTNFINARDISHTSETVDPNTLKPTQADFNPAKVEDMLGVKGDRSILVSSDGYILDGTHQWLADQKGGEPSQIIRFDAPITDLISLAHEFPSSRPSEENATEAQTHPAVEPFTQAEATPQQALDRKLQETRLVEAGKQAAAKLPDPRDAPNWPSRTVETEPGRYSIYSSQLQGGRALVPQDFKPGDPIPTFSSPEAAREAAPALRQLQPHEETPDSVIADRVQQEAKGPAPAARPRDFFQAVADHLAQRTKQAGIRVRISAEDAINHGVPADEIFINPKAKYPTVKLRMAKVFATTKAPLNSKAAPAHIVSLDDLGDRFDPEQFGAPKGDGLQDHRMAPEVAGDLLARSLARDDTALDQQDKRYEAYQREKDQTANEYAQGAARARLEELAQQHDLKLNEDEYQNAMDYLARGTSHEYALAATIRDAAARTFDEDAARFDKEWPKEIASDLYEGENAEPRGDGHEEAGNEPGPEHGRAAGEAPHGGQPEAGVGAGEGSPDDRAQRPVSETGNATGESDERAGAAEHGRGNGPAETPELLNEKAKPEDILGPRPTDTRDMLQRKADEGLKAKAEQKPVGSDGGLFDTQDTTGDLFAKKPEEATKTVTPADPVEKAKAILQQGLDALNGKEAQPEAKPEPVEPNKTPEERGLKPLFDSEEPTKQVGFFDDKTGKTELSDVGEKIGGARKDLWAERGLALSDLEGMSRGEAHQFVTKDNVWPKPDYEKLEGVPPEVAAGVKLLRDSLAARPKIDSDEGRRNYIEAMQVARKVLDETKTPEDLRSVQRRLYEGLGVDNRSYYDRTPEEKAARDKLFSIFKGNRADFSIDYKMRRKIEQMVEQGWPGKAIEGWTRRFDVRKAYRKEGPEEWFVTTKGKRRTIAAKDLPSKEAAEAKAKELYEGLTKNPDGTKKAPVRPHLDKLERTGADVRNGRDVQPEDFLHHFGFRGVEYGNWVANDERQKATNLAFEGLHDLADTLQIPPETLSLGGQLGLAFGARGSGSAAAHYEPGKLVINLTKIKGAGTLAHEWGHALDHYFGSLDSETGTRGAPTYGSGGRSPYNFKALGSLRPDLAQAFDGVMQTLFKRDKTRAEVVRDAELKIEQIKAGIARQEEQVAAYKNRPEGVGDKGYAEKFAKQSQEWIAFQNQRLKGFGKILADARDESKPLTPQKVESSFYQHAQMLSGQSGATGYWARPTELFARSFEAYVNDKIKERGNKSQYLVHSVEENSFPAAIFGGNPYPTGEERKAINAAFDKLFNVVETRDIPAPREGGPTKALGQAGDVTKAPVFYSALERGIENSTTKRAPAEQWLATLKKTPGVKQEELNWSGVEDWLKMQKGPVEKEALLGVIRDHGIKVDEVLLGGEPDFSDVEDMINGRVEGLVDDVVRERYGSSQAAFEELGPEGYSDLLGQIEENIRDHHGAELQAEARADIQDQHGPQFQSWSSDQSNPSYRELLITLPRGEGGNPERSPSTHWDQEAVVAHARFMDKTDADGKKVLFVEEVQSDWHQKGRDQGYESEVTEEQKAEAKRRVEEAQAQQTAANKAIIAKAPEVLAKWAEVALPEGIELSQYGKDRKRDYEEIKRRLDTGATDGGTSPDLAEDIVHFIRQTAFDPLMKDELRAYNDARLAFNEASQAEHNVRARGIPDAPFKSSWPALVMKRIIRWAVDNGYDKVAWTTGQEQADRYNLENHIGRIELADNSSGGIGNASLEGPFTGGTLRAYTPDGQRILHEYVHAPEHIEEKIGKEMSDRLLAAEPQHTREAGMGLRLRRLEGLDLRTGGEGMKGFYDRNLVNITNDLIKKYGGKVEPVHLPGSEVERTLFVRDHPDVREARGAALLIGDQLREAPDGPEAEALAAQHYRAREHAYNEEQRIRDEFDKGKPHAGFELTPQLKEAASSGLPLFKRGAAKIELTPEQEAKLKTELQAQLDKMIPGNRIRLNAGVGEALAKGTWNAQYWLRTITIALDKAKNPFESNAHEIYHGISPKNGIGLLTKTEYNMVNDAGWRDPLIRGQVKAAYGHEEDWIQKEEAGAYWIQKQWAQAHGTLAQRVVGKIKAFFSAVRQAALNVAGKEPGRTAEDVARDLFSGKIGERPEGFDQNTVRGRPVSVTFGRKPVGQADDERPIRISDSHPDRLFKPVRAVLDAIRDGTSEAVGKAIDNFRTEIQDRMLPVLRTQASVERMLGRKITEDENPYLAEELFHGRVGARLDNLSHDFVEPIFAQMREAGIKPEEFDSYLYARHAPERNERISQINPKFASDLLGKGKAGSGMTNEEAASIMRDVAASGKQPIYESMAAKVDGMLKQALDTRLESGLLSPEEAAAWRRTYKNYVPLRGLPGDEETEGTRINRASGFTVKGKESRMAFGRVSKAQDILAHSILQADEAIIRSEQNEVAKALGALAKAAPDKSFWQVDKIRKVPVFNKSTGQVSYRSESRIAAEDAPYTVSYKEGGTEHRVVFNHRDPTAKRTAAAMRNLNVQQMHFVVRTVGAINRLLSKMYTSFVPEFVISNGFRDLQSAAFYLPAQDLKGLTTKVAKDYPAALVAATKGSFGKEDTSDWGKWHREFRMAGGHTAFNDMRSVADLQREIAAATKMRGPLHPISMGKALLHVVENTNDGVENALRLATFKNARELGASPKQAASLAKNVTVNFNRKGTIGPVLNTLYLFFNASIQDDARILMLLGKSRKVQAFAASMVALGYAMQMMNTARSDKDKDGDLFYNKINEYDQERNLIIMVDGKNYIKIPLQWGLNTFPNFGRMLARMYQGERPMKALGDFTNATLDSFSPVGAGRLVETMTPTIARPVVDLTENRDYADRPIMPDEKEPGHQVPNTQRYWQSVPPYDKALTDFMGKLTGGDNVRPGAIDISPETLHYLSNQVFGGVGTFFANLASMGSKALSNDPTDVIQKNEIPFERRVYGSKPDWYDRAAYLARVQEIQQEVSYAETYLKEGNLPGARSMVGSPDDLQLLKLAPQAQAAQDAMNELHKQLGELENAQAAGRISAAQFKADKLKLQQSQQQVVDAFNAIYLRNVSKPTRP